QPLLSVGRRTPETLAYAWLLIERLSERWQPRRPVPASCAAMSNPPTREKRLGQPDSRSARNPPPADDMPDLLISVLTNPDSFPTGISAVKYEVNLWLSQGWNNKSERAEIICWRPKVTTGWRSRSAVELCAVARCDGIGSQPTAGCALDCLVAAMVQETRRPAVLASWRLLSTLAPEQPIPLIANAFELASPAYRAYIRLAELAAEPTAIWFVLRPSISPKGTDPNSPDS
uniref:DUF3322 domain-containing protein n=1 Tax=Macrostomum lignano TaxID=282301 RepID=A0A1I8FTZ2_9PLAT